MSADLESLCFIKVKVNKLLVSALVDSGSHFSLISQRFFNKLRLTITPFSKDDECSKLYGAGGSPLKLLGKCDLLLDIESLVLPITVFVCANLTQELLLGRKFLAESYAQLDFPNKRITFSDCVDVPLHDKLDRQ